MTSPEIKVSVACAWLIITLFNRKCQVHSETTSPLFGKHLISILMGKQHNKTRTGEVKGWMKRDLFLPNRINVYYKYGNMRGYWVRDIFNPDTWFFKKGQ